MCCRCSQRGQPTVLILQEGQETVRKCHLTHVENHEASYTLGVQLLDKKVWAGLESAQLKETKTVTVMRTLVRPETLNLGWGDK